jgi:hypothetical protein
VKSQLEDWLEQALKSHPDIKVADAKLRAALAEMEQARGQVMQKVLALYHAIQAQKATADRAAAELARLEALHKSGSVQSDLRDAARANLVAAQAKLAELQAQADQLTGKTATSVLLRDMAEHSLHRAEWTAERVALARWVIRSELTDPVLAARPTAGPMADRIRKALDRTVTEEFNGKDLATVVTELKRHADDVFLQVRPGVTGDRPFTANFREVPLGAVLQWLEDTLPSGCRVVVRDYGILIAQEKDVPRGAIPLAEFWKPAGKPPAK